LCLCVCPRVDVVSGSIVHYLCYLSCVCCVCACACVNVVSGSIVHYLCYLSCVCVCVCVCVVCVCVTAVCMCDCTHLCVCVSMCACGSVSVKTWCDILAKIFFGRKTFLLFHHFLASLVHRVLAGVVTAVVCVCACVCVCVCVRARVRVVCLWSQRTNNGHTKMTTQGAEMMKGGPLAE